MYLARWVSKKKKKENWGRLELLIHIRKKKVISQTLWIKAKQFMRIIMSQCPRSSQFFLMQNFGLADVLVWTITEKLRGQR